MTSSDLTTSVTRRTAAAVAVLTLAGGWLGGAPGAAGVLAGGALALGSFRWLAARVVAVSAGPAMPSAWIAVTGLRLAPWPPAARRRAAGFIRSRAGRLHRAARLARDAGPAPGAGGERPVDVIEHRPIFSLMPNIPDHVTYTWLVMIILAGLAFVASRNVALAPRGVQNFIEVVLEQFLQMIDDVIGREGRRYLPLIATLVLFILIGNLLGLVPGMNGPTTNLNTNAACALVVFFAYHWIGVRKQGAVTYLQHFMGPVPLALKPLMFVIEIISHLARPLSLTLCRLAICLAATSSGHHLLLMGRRMTAGPVRSGRCRRGGMGGRDRLDGRISPAEDPGLVSPGVHLRDAHDALHRGRGRGSRAPWRRAPTGASLAHHTYRGGGRATFTDSGSSGSPRHPWSGPRSRRAGRR
jgi:F-type H+-transporting ATPase subunit a